LTAAADFIQIKEPAFFQAGFSIFAALAEIENPACLARAGQLASGFVVVEFGSRSALVDGVAADAAPGGVCGDGAPFCALFRSSQ
jgi:hypothetical protein